MSIFTAIGILKKRINKILASFILLLTFVIGQVIVFAHNHNAEAASINYAVKKHKASAIDAKCQICSQSGHVQLLLQTHQLFFYTTSQSHQFVVYTAVYQSIKLLLSGNRGPPAIG
jgi:hypothetical protein